jgi:hypothetical protein
MRDSQPLRYQSICRWLAKMKDRLYQPLLSDFCGKLRKRAREAWQSARAAGEAALN